MVMKIEPLVTALESICPPGATRGSRSRARPPPPRTSRCASRRPRQSSRSVGANSCRRAHAGFIDERLHGDYVPSGGGGRGGGDRRGLAAHPGGRQRGSLHRSRSRTATEYPQHQAGGVPRRACAGRPAVGNHAEVARWRRERPPPRPPTAAPTCPRPIPRTRNPSEVPVLPSLLHHPVPGPRPHLTSITTWTYTTSRGPPDYARRAALLRGPPGSAALLPNESSSTGSGTEVVATLPATRVSGGSRSNLT
jgi:hypothetical protein